MPIGNGGIIGPLNTTSLSSASGVWSVAEMQQAKGNDTWPETNPVGQEAYTTPGTYTWIAPPRVFSVSVVAVGGGGGGGHTSNFSGGGGGGLGWKNSISITPGNSYTVVVGARGVAAASSNGTDGGDSYFVSTGTVAGFGGKGGRAGTDAAGGTYAGDGGGNGGASRANNNAAGGGAGGYSGNGGQSNTTTAGSGSAGSGGGGGGGGQTGSGTAGSLGNYSTGGGGGVGILGEGASGAGGIGNSTLANAAGKGGSGGDNGIAVPGVGSGGGGGTGGLYGGGGCSFHYGYISGQGNGAAGAVRIIWPGTLRQFPSTRTTDEA